MLYMDTIKSSEFRKTYASLRQPTNVTVNGHVMGQWIPANSATYVMATLKGDHEVFGLTPPEGALLRSPKAGDPLFAGFNSRPFTPVPKKGKR